MNSSTPAQRTTLNKPSLHKPALYRHFHRIAWLAVALASCVIVFGAFVRLSNAGLSCPDWPTCYGKAAWPTHAEQIVDHIATEIRPAACIPTATASPWRKAE